MKQKFQMKFLLYKDALHIILPGVGAFGKAMKKIKHKNISFKLNFIK